MRLSVFLLMSCAVLALAGCAGPGRYPITGAECGPDDPVLDMDVPNCPPFYRFDQGRRITGRDTPRRDPVRATWGNGRVRRRAGFRPLLAWDASPTPNSV